MYVHSLLVSVSWRRHELLTNRVAHGYVWLRVLRMHDACAVKQPGISVTVRLYLCTLSLVGTFSASLVAEYTGWVARWRYQKLWECYTLENEILICELEEGRPMKVFTRTSQNPWATWLPIRVMRAYTHWHSVSVRVRSHDAYRSIARRSTLRGRCARTSSTFAEISKSNTIEEQEGSRASLYYIWFTGTGFSRREITWVRKRK